MRLSFTLHTEPAREGGSNALADSDLERLVTEMVRRELSRLIAQGPPLGQPAEQSQFLAAVQWLAPFLQQTILEAVRLGLSIRDQTPAGAATPLTNPEHASGDEPRPSAGDLPAPAEQNPIPETVSEPVEVDEPPTVWDEHPVDVLPATNGSSVDVAPILVTGQLTLVASPFAGFAQVQRFLNDLGRVPRIYDARPKRFTGGRLYVTLGTEYTDTKALADTLRTELAPYRPELRSVQSDLVELLLKPPAA